MPVASQTGLRMRRSLPSRSSASGSFMIWDRKNVHGESQERKLWREHSTIEHDILKQHCDRNIKRLGRGIHAIQKESTERYSTKQSKLHEELYPSGRMILDGSVFYDLAKASRSVAQQKRAQAGRNMLIENNESTRKTRMPARLRIGKLTEAFHKIVRIKQEHRPKSDDGGKDQSNLCPRHLPIF